MARSINWISDDNETSMLRMKLGRQMVFKNASNVAEAAAPSPNADNRRKFNYAETAPGPGADNLRDISVLRLALERQAAVCKLNIGPSTGFLIAENILITCNHVLPNEEIAKWCKATFNLQLDDKRMPLTPDEYGLDPTSLFVTDPELDITIVKTAGKPGEKWGFIQLARVSPKEGNSAIIIQHPSRLRYKKIALGDMEIKHVCDKKIQYLSDTLPGSSGSPIFNDDFSLIGIHRAGDWNPNDNIYFRNEGVHINAVIDFLESLKREELSHIVPRPPK
ncbi:MAG: serine protease [Blastocatellales bacterium]